MKISIAARDDDLDIVVALVTELLGELGAEGREFAGIDTTELEAVLGEGLVSGRFIALLARDDSSEALGVLTLSETFAIYAGGRYGVIEEMYVRPAFRERGVGRALLERAVTVAADRGWRRLEVTAPEDDAGSGAARFYQRRGFRFSGSKLRLLLT
jgi:GNAT superfamily N-acetyltransferase